MIDRIVADIRACMARGIVPSEIVLCREWFDELLRDRPDLGGDAVIMPAWSPEHGHQQTIVRPMGS